MLDRVFDDDPSDGAELGIGRTGFDELFELLPAQIEGGCEIPRRVAVHVAVPMGFDVLAKDGIACGMTKLDHRLAFERRGQSLLAEIAADLLKRIREESFPTVRPQADVNMKDTLLSRLDPLQQFLREALEVFAVLDAMFPLRAAGAAVHEQHFDVGGIAQLTAAEFSCAHDGKMTRLSV